MKSWSRTSGVSPFGSSFPRITKEYNEDVTLLDSRSKGLSSISSPISTEVDIVNAQLNLCEEGEVSTLSGRTATVCEGVSFLVGEASLLTRRSQAGSTVFVGILLSWLSRNCTIEDDLLLELELVDALIIREYLSLLMYTVNPSPYLYFHKKQ